MSLRSYLFTILFSVVLIVPAVAEQKKHCEHCQHCRHDENSIPHNDGTYAFTYESWIKEFNEEFLIVNCVFNKKQKDMYVDWRGPGVKGYAKPDCCVENCVPLPIDSVLDDSSYLYYGTGRTKITAKHKRPKDEVATSLRSLRSTIRISIAKSASAGPERGLVDLDVIFVADALELPGDKGYLYSYSWHNASAKKRGGDGRSAVRILLKTDESSALQSMYKNLLINKMPLRELKVTGKRTGIYFVAHEKPKYKLLQVTFINAEEEEAGGGIVAVYAPGAN